MEALQQPVDVSDRALPGFVKGWAITDLVLSSLRLLQVLFSLLLFLLSLVLHSAESSTLLLGMIVTEAVLSGLIGVTGITAAVAILRHKRWGVSCGWICAVLTILSILQQVISVVMVVSAGAGGDSSTFQLGFISGFLCSSGARVALLVIYGLMLVRARRFFDAV